MTTEDELQAFYGFLHMFNIAGVELQFRCSKLSNNTLSQSALLLLLVVLEYFDEKWYASGFIKFFLFGDNYLEPQKYKEYQ